MRRQDKSFVSRDSSLFVLFKAKDFTHIRCARHFVTGTDLALTTFKLNFIIAAENKRCIN